MPQRPPASKLATHLGSEIYLETLLLPLNLVISHLLDLWLQVKGDLDL